jgi:WD40 repeat protein/serine/threonine protein kinase
MMEDLVGRKIKGYELRERIGAGGFGAVYRGYQSTVGREVAIKIILPGYTNHPDFIRRFEAEAQLVARLEHLHIAPLYDYWRDPEGAFLVMRYLRGGNLSDALKKGPFDLESAALLLDQISSAISLAHSNNIIHRDIKPENILLDEDGNAYLADFGIAKDVKLQAASSTQKDAIMGSPDYIAPEQARSEHVTPRTDIYSLGIVLYEVLTGEHPFPNLTPVERLFKHLNDPVPKITGFDSDVSKAVNAVIQRATAKNPEQRFSEVRAFAAEFREAAGLSVSQAARSIVELLTPREQEVLKLILGGRSNREIADELVIELTSVKWYVNQIYRKLNVRSRVQAIVRARELNLIFEGGTRRADSTTSLTGLPEPENPYRGLSAFQIADERHFFGREKLLAKLLSRLGEDVEYTRFLAIVGPSGSGKSSLVKAGLIPALWRGGLPNSERWFIVEMLPSERPMDELEIALMRIAALPSGNLMEQLQRDAHGLTRAAKLILPEDGSELLLVIDQFEELFTLVPDESIRLHFLGLLHLAVTDPRSRVRVVVTLRADFYDRPLQHPEFGVLVQGRTETVLPLSAEELERAIVRPAAAVGVRFEEGLVASIVEEVHYQPGALPLMQYALTELFEHREDHTLTHAGYKEIGGSVGALAKRIEEIYSELPDDGREQVRQMFLRLVTLGEGAEDTRRRVPRSELLAIGKEPELAEEIIDTFTASRLLSLDHDPATRSPMVELAHEAILREWERLRGWLDESRTDIRQQRGLAAAAREWEASGKDGSYLLRGMRLSQYEQWSGETRLAFTSNERQYLEASLVERDREATEEAARQARETDLEWRRRRLSRAFTLALGVGLVVALGLSAFAFNQRQSALRQAGVLLAAQAESEVEAGFYDRAVLLALEALEEYPYTSQAEHALGQAVSYNRALQQYIGHNGAVTGVDWSPDGTRVASTGIDNTVHIWDAATGDTLRVINLPEGITGNIYDWGLAVKWSPDGNELLTITGDRYLLGSQDYDLTIWDVSTGQQVMTIELPNRGDPSVGRGTNTSAEHWSTGSVADYAPRSGQLATVGGDNTAIVWDLSLDRQRTVFAGHEAAVNAVDWSPDETRLATASEDGTARLWDVQTGAQLLALVGHGSPVNQVVWSLDGLQLASAADDGTVRLWDARTGDLVKTVNVDAGIVWSLAWSSDGLRLVIGTDDGRIRLWDIDSEQVVGELNGHNSFITGLAWSPIDQLVVSAGNDGVVRVWNGAPTTSASTLPYRYVAQPDWSSDSRYLALPAGDWWGGNEGPKVVVWDVFAYQTLAEGLVFRQDWYANQLYFSPDDQLLLLQTHPGPMKSMAADDYRAIAPVLDIHTGEIVKSFSVDRDSSLVRTARWAPDGTKVAAGTLSFAEGVPGVLAVWDFQTGELVTTATCGSGVNTLDWSPDGTRIAILCSLVGGTEYKAWIQVQDAVTGETVLTLSDPDPTAMFNSVRWSPDGTRLMTTGGSDEIGSEDNPVIIWDANTGEKLVAILRHLGQVWWGTWSPNSQRVVTGSTDDTARIWDAATGAELLTLSTPNDWEVAPEWSPDGKYVAVGAFSLDGSAESQVWRVWQTTEELIAYAKECCVFRVLTPEERERFGLQPGPEQEPLATPPADGAAASPAVPIVFAAAGVGLLVKRLSVQR